MSKYMSHLYIAGHYAATILLYGILVLSIAGWLAALTGGSTLPTLPLTIVFIGTVNLVPLFCLVPGLLAAAMLTFIPSGKRLMKLELSHRSFQTGMEDVRQAFYIAFTADRTGMFRLTEQFDAVILTLAAQMSFEARELAARFSTENVTRANGIIAERLAEVEAVEALITTIEQTKAHAKRTLARLAAIKGTAALQLETDMSELETLLGPYGFVRQPVPETNVVTMVPVAG